MNRRIVVFSEEARLWQFCEELLRECVHLAENAGNRPGLLFTGGSTFVPLYDRLGDFPADVFLTDERMVPEGSGADTGAMIDREWHSRLINPMSNFVPVSRQADADTTAQYYEQVLRDWTSKGGGWAAALIGLGQDGHIASLFPGQRSIWEGNQSWVIAAEAEQEPRVPRVTVTPTLFAQIPRHVVVLVGAEKTDIAGRWLRDGEQLPAAFVEPSEEQFILLDRNAARDLGSLQYEQR